MYFVPFLLVGNTHYKRRMNPTWKISNNGVSLFLTPSLKPIIFNYNKRYLKDGYISKKGLLCVITKTKDENKMPSEM